MRSHIMGAAALKKTDLSAAATLDSRPQPAALSMVSQKIIATKSETKSVAPDFEEFMNQYGMWSDFA